jgi:Lactonase, 7-bladed beta-propeller
VRYWLLSILIFFAFFCSKSDGTTASSPTTGTSSVQTEFLFVTSLIESSGGNENLLLFEKSSSSCSLTLLNTYTVGPDPYDLVYHRNTSTLYVANSGNATINAFKFNTSTKTLTAAGSVTQASPPTTTALPFMMAVHNNGFVYSVDGNATGSSIGHFTQNTSTGALTQFANPNEYTTTAGRSWFIALVGNHLYVNDYTNNLIRQYSVNPTTGLLTPLGMPTIPTGAQPWSMFAHPSGNYLYTTNSSVGSGSVSQYARDTSTGQLTTIGGGPHATGQNTIGLAVGTGYLFASATGSARIYQFNINSFTGALTAHGTPNSYVSTVRPNPYGLILSRNEDCLYAAELEGTTGASANDEIGIYSVNSGILARQGSISGGIGPRFFALAY